MIASDAKTIAVASDDPDIELRISDLAARGYGNGTTVYGVEAVALDVVSHTRAAADTTDEYSLIGSRSYSCQGAL